MDENILRRGYIAAQVGESLANYPLADELLAESSDLACETRTSNERLHTYSSDKEFWSNAIAGIGVPNGAYLNFRKVALTEWVPRIPGLYWTDQSAKMRDVSPATVEIEAGRWITYNPLGKSQFVSGGIGTLKFPPDPDGFRLVTLTTSCNASAGVPALVSGEVWDYHNLEEGAILYCRGARWNGMPRSWAREFRSVTGIPRGCLILDDPETISKQNPAHPVQIHPYSIMEYWDGNARMHDFVYATANSLDPAARSGLSEFFHTYSNANGREGRYLTAADISDPLWDAVFADPEDMRSRNPVILHLIQERVREAVAGHETIDALIRKLVGVDGTRTLCRISDDAGIASNRWFRNEAVGEEVSRLVDAALCAGKLLPLFHATQKEFT